MIPGALHRPTHGGYPAPRRTREEQYREAWLALSEPLAWMQEGVLKHSPYWGWNLAEIANDLIRLAYPMLAPSIPAGKEGP